MCKELKTLAEIQIEDKRQVLDKFTSVSKEMVSELGSTKTRWNLTENKVDSIKLSVDLMTAKFEETNSCVIKLEKHISGLKESIMKFNDDKVDRLYMNSKYEVIEDGIETLDRSMSIYDNRIISLENYIDKYVPIQIQAMITESIKPIIQSETQSKRYMKHVEKQMNKLHEKILSDEGVWNIEISMELLGGQMAKVTGKEYHPPQNVNKASSQAVGKQTFQESKSSKHIVSVESEKDNDGNKNNSIPEREDFEEESEKLSNESPSPNKEIQKLRPESVLNNNDGSVENLGGADTIGPSFKKAFVKKEGQYQIQEFRRYDTGYKPANTIDSKTGFIPDIKDVEEVLYDLQNNYINLETKVKEQIKSFCDKIQNQYNEIEKQIEFTNNQMNIYMQMIHQDLEIMKEKKN